MVAGLLVAWGLVAAIVFLSARYLFEDDHPWWQDALAALLWPLILVVSLVVLLEGPDGPPED